MFSYNCKLIDERKFIEKLNDVGNFSNHNWFLNFLWISCTGISPFVRSFIFWITIHKNNWTSLLEFSELILGLLSDLIAALLVFFLWGGGDFWCFTRLKSSSVSLWSLVSLCLDTSTELIALRTIFKSNLKIISWLITSYASYKKQEKK